jgi:hypothetical protein
MRSTRTPDHVAHSKQAGSRRRQPRSSVVKTSPIIVSKCLPVVSLQASYGLEQEGVVCIDGRTPEAQREKDRFQRDACRYANALGQTLAVHGGFTGQSVTRNRGGQSDAGSVMARYIHPTCRYWLSVYIESDHTRTAIPRPDGVIIIACRRPVQGRQRERMHELNPALSSLDLAQVLLLLAGLKQAVELVDQTDLYGASSLWGPDLFGNVAIEEDRQTNPGEGRSPVVRVRLLGDYRRCLVLEATRETVGFVCIDEHPRVALAYWGQRITQPLQRVHPDDRARCEQAWKLG